MNLNQNEAVTNENKTISTPTTDTQIAKQAPIDKTIIIVSSIVLLVLVLASFLFSGETNAMLQKSIRIFGENTGIFYMIANVLAFATTIYFAVSKWGDFKFGDPDEKPEFSLFSWGSMIFCTCIGGAVLYWASLEPIMHLKQVPFSHIEPMSDEAFEWSMTFMLFRPWLIWWWYVLPTLPLCYLLYIKKGTIMRFSELMIPIIGEKWAKGMFGKVIEILFVISVILTYAGVFAVSTPLCSASIAAILGIEHSIYVDIFVLSLCTVMFMWSTYVGLQKGIRFLSEVNVYIAIGFCAFILLAGPTIFIFNSTSYSFGLLLDNFFTLMLGKEPYAETTFATDWTQFIILWQIAAAPLMALFTARISRGRTIREILVWGVVAGIGGQYLMFSCFGNLGLYLQYNGIVDLVTIMETQGQAASLVAMFSALPFPKLVLGVCVVFMTIFTATCIDSTAYVLAATSSKEMKPGQEPHVINRFYWAILQAIIALAFIFIGALTATKVLGSYAGFAMLVPMGFAIATWFKYCMEYYRSNKVSKKLTF